jgi:hypothetical protein
MRAKVGFTMFKKLMAKLTGKDEKKSEDVNAFKESKNKKSE